MRKSSLALPVKYQNQARLIKQRNHRHSLEYRSMPVKTPSLSCMMKKATTTFLPWNMTKYCDSLLTIIKIAGTGSISLSCTHDPSSISHPWFTRLWGISIMPLWGVYRECEYKFLNSLYYHSISYKINNNHSCHVTWWKMQQIVENQPKWHNFPRNRSLTSGPFRNMSSLIDIDVREI